MWTVVRPAKSLLLLLIVLSIWILSTSESAEGRVSLGGFVGPSPCTVSLKTGRDYRQCRPLSQRTSSGHSRGFRLQRIPANNNNDGGHLHQDFDDFVDDNEFYEGSSTPKSALSSDWMEAELTLLRAVAVHTTPHPDMTAEDVAVLCIRSLQFVDHPTPMAGLQRCYSFFTPECRKLVTARQGGQSIERFCQYGILSPAMQPFMGATRVDVGWDRSTITPAQPPHRGVLASVPVEIRGAAVLAGQYGSGLERRQDGGIALMEPPITHIVLRLEQQRRPPYQECWMVREILDVRHAFAGDMGNAHVGG